MKRDILTSLVSLLFPPVCHSCNRRITQGYLCPSCSALLAFLVPPLCSRCGFPLRPPHQHAQCMHTATYYDQLISCTYYQEPLSSLIHLYKYHHRDYLADYFAEIMTTFLSSFGFTPQNYDCCTALPLHNTKLREREYNQSELIARRICEYFKIPYAEKLLRCHFLKPSQTKMNKTNRLLNVEHIFSATSSLSGKRVLLIDDIVTTTATINQCSRAIKSAGAEHITALTLAKTPRKNSKPRYVKQKFWLS